MDTITNVYTNPEKEREYALSLTYPIIKNNGSPGKTTSATYNPLSESYQKIDSYFKTKGSHIHVVDHSYRVTMSNDPYDCFVHTDSSDYQIVISLTPYHHIEDVECYLKHNATGVNSIEYLRRVYDNQYAEGVIPAMRDAYKTHDFKGNDGIDTMSIIATEPIEYNKAIIINCRRFHAPSKGHFGDNVLNARLMEIYTIKVRSMFTSTLFPYVWYHPDVIADEDCDALINLIRQMDIRPEAADAFFEYKSNLLKRAVYTYFDHIRDTSPDLDEFLTLANSKTKLELDLELVPEYLPRFSNKNWNYNLSGPNGAFSVLIQLNDNSTGLSLYNHYARTTEIISAKKGSLLIYPHSWLYPVMQTRIMDGEKYLVSGIITTSSLKTTRH
jgi:hypothetical protein